MPGWVEDDHEAAFAAFRLSAREIMDRGTGFERVVMFGATREAWQGLCADALRPQPARPFFEQHFRPFRVHDPVSPEGLFTGYFEPEVDGSRVPSSVFHVPLYRRPPDLPAAGRHSEGEARSYLTRREIEEGGLSGQGLELVWLRDWADAFFIHIQGSGRVRLAEGGTLRLSFAAKSGLPYTSIGSILAARGDIPRERLSMQAIRRWMAAHPAEARLLMWENESFVFFREVSLENPGLGALGAQHVQLTPVRSLAVDRRIWMFGTPVWLDTMIPAEDEGAMTKFRHLLIAQDTGSAIRGAARGDIYFGSGDAAGERAGPMKSQGRMTVLLPAAMVPPPGHGA